MTSRTTLAGSITRAANPVDGNAFETAWADAEGRAALDRILADNGRAVAAVKPHRRSVVIYMKMETFQPPYDYSKLIWIGGKPAFQHMDVPLEQVAPGTGKFIPPQMGTDSITLTIRPDDLPPQDTVRIGFPADRAGQRMGVGVYPTDSGLYCLALPTSSEPLPTR